MSVRAILDFSGHDLSVDPRAVRAVKRGRRVTAEFAAADGLLETLEGPVRYLAGDALIRDAEGHRWPVARERFDTIYETPPAGPSGATPNYRARRIEVFARRIRWAFKVRVGFAQDWLTGGSGDWLVQYEPRHHGIVEAEIFQKTYRPRT